MPAPLELQQLFATAIAGQPAAAFLDLLDGDSLRSQQGLAAYQRSVPANRVGALAATYPVVERIVGEEFFRMLARRYARACPSRSGDLNEYGESFAEFMRDQPELETLGYLPDVARLEWCVQTAAMAADAEVQDFSVLQACAPEQWDELRFVTDPSALRLDSAWPLVAIWEVNQPGYEGDPCVDFSVGSQALIQRRDVGLSGKVSGDLSGGVAVEPLSPALAAFADALLVAASLTAALLAAQQRDAAFDLTAALTTLIRNGVLRRAYLLE